MGNLQAYTNNFGEHLFQAFVVCFCESGNQLSQWREYADRGGGYCLGFKFSSATRITQDIQNLDEGRRPFLRKIIYAPKKQRELVKQYIDAVVAAAVQALNNGSHSNDPDNTAPAVMAPQASNVLLDMLLTFKHPAFCEEKEWRLIRVTREDHEPEHLCFKQTLGFLVPYRPTYVYEVSGDSSPRFPLRSVGFGPTLEPVRTSSAIKLFLHHVAKDQHPIVLAPAHLQIKGAGFSIR